MASIKAPTTPNDPAPTGKRPIADSVQQEQEQEQDQGNSPPRKKVRTGSAPSSEKGDAADSTGASNTPSSASSDAQDAASTSREVSRSPPASRAEPGLRTSFGATAQGSNKRPNYALLAHNPLTAQERDDLVRAIKAGEDKVIPSYNKKHFDWTINPIRSEWLVGSTWLEIFDSVIDKWSTAFAAENMESVRQVGLQPSLIHTTFKRRLAVSITPGVPKIFWQTVKTKLYNPEKVPSISRLCQSLKPNPKPPAEVPVLAPAEPPADEQEPQETTKESKAARRKRRKEEQRKKHQELAAARHSATEPTVSTESSVSGNSLPPGNDSSTMPATKQDEQNTTQVSAQGAKEQVGSEAEHIQEPAAEMDGDADIQHEAPSQAELDQRHCYYPGLPDDAVFCLTCAQPGHSTTSCPETICKFCQGSHFKYECPTRQRCAKCKQSGHTKASCTEKLAVAPGEVAVECAFCESHDHTEYNCNSLWQVYRPKPGKVKKVKSLPTFCYCCGQDGHYGGDCTMVKKSVPPTKTWTISAASIYVDAASSEIALAYQNPLPPPAVVAKPVIPGRSIKPQSHIFYEESDDENQADGFVRGSAPASGTKSIGKIQIASNINFGGASATPGTVPQNTQQQQQQNANARYPRRNRNPWPDPPPRPPPRPGAKQYPSRNQPNAPKSKPGQSQQQQGGGRGGRGGNRGRGGFSSFSKRGRGRGRGG